MSGIVVSRGMISEVLFDCGRRMFGLKGEILHMIPNSHPIQDGPKWSTMMNDVGSLVPICSEILEVPFGISQ
jgi:hypothetical protein